MFDNIKSRFREVLNIKEEDVIDKALSDETLRAQMVDLNQEQLYEKGIQADGTPTGYYHPRTIAYKIEHGDARGIPGRADHITGLDTGITYNSMKVESEPEGVVITADDRNDFFKREDKGLGLTEESLSEIRPHVKEEIIETLLEAYNS